MPKPRKSEEPAAVAPQASAEATASESAAAEPTRSEDRAAQADAKLQRMLTTNKICFRHQNDLGRIEEELVVQFNYSQSELEHILEPKGQKLIPGYSYGEIERQRQYVGFLGSKERKPKSHTDQVDQSREQSEGPQR